MLGSHLAQTYVSFLQVATVSVSSISMLVFLALEGLVSLRSSTTTGSYILILLLSPPLQCSLSPEEKDFFF